MSLSYVGTDWKMSTTFPIRFCCRLYCSYMSFKGNRKLKKRKLLSTIENKKKR